MMWWLSMAWATVPGRLVGDVPGAVAFDYCDWHFTEPTPEAPTLPSAPDERDVAERVSIMLIQTGVQIAEHSPSAKACARAFRSGTARDARAYKKMRAKIRSAYEPVEDPSLASVQAQIADLWEQDQSARRVYLRSQTDDTHGRDAWARALATRRAAEADHTSTTVMKDVVDTHGWVDAHRFTMPIARHAWLLVQHADRDPEFQARVLELMAPYVESKGARPEDYAYLFDRVAVNHDRPQRYGTQPTWECDASGSLMLATLEDPDRVDERRAEMSLGPVADSLAEMSRNVCR